MHLLYFSTSDLVQKVSILYSFEFRICLCRQNKAHRTLLHRQWPQVTTHPLYYYISIFWTFREPCMEMFPLQSQIIVFEQRNQNLQFCIFSFIFLRLYLVLQMKWIYFLASNLDVQYPFQTYNWVLCIYNIALKYTIFLWIFSL